MPEHTVAAGDCILSIAEENGFHWETIWNHASNSQLKAARGDPNVLFPGDVVFVPEKRLKEATKPTDQTHKFVKKGTPGKVRLRLLDWKRGPRKGARYSAEVDGVTVEGTADGDGMIEFYARANARQVNLVVTEETRTERYSLQLGHVDPVTTDSGVKRRLENLGYLCEGEEALRGALLAFQKEKQLDETGEADDATRAALQRLHGC